MIWSHIHGLQQCKNGRTQPLVCTATVHKRSRPLCSSVHHCGKWRQCCFSYFREILNEATWNFWGASSEEFKITCSCFLHTDLLTLPYYLHSIQYVHLLEQPSIEIIMPDVLCLKIPTLILLLLSLFVYVLISCHVDKLFTFGLILT